MPDRLDSEGDALVGGRGAHFLETARHDRLYALWAVALAIGLRRGRRSGFGGSMWT